MSIRLCRLQRTLVRLRASGIAPAPGRPGVASYLQGLVTNDMAHLHPNARCIYSLFLNPKGRILFDSLIYSTPDPDAYLLECDQSIIEQFQKHLKMYRVGRKIDIDIAEKSVWALYDDSLGNHASEIQGIIKHSKETKQTDDSIDFHKDPRTSLLGIRILTPSSISEDQIIKHINNPALRDCSSLNNYVNFRYQLGVPEGVENLPTGISFPLESNCDYLNGVSFQKGCYIGQELTARTYHTGVVRKRLMPIFFDDKISIEIPYDTPVFDPNNPKTSIGKIRGISENMGIGLLRINEALSASSLTILGNNAKTQKPKWWPKDSA